MGLGQNDAAIASLDTNARLSPGDFGAQLNALYRAIAHFQSGRLDPAVECVERAFALEPEYLGVLLARTGPLGLAGRPQLARQCVCSGALRPDRQSKTMGLRYRE